MNQVIFEVVTLLTRKPSDISNVSWNILKQEVQLVPTNHQLLNHNNPDEVMTSLYGWPLTPGWLHWMTYLTLLQCSSTGGRYGVRLDWFLWRHECWCSVPSIPSFISSSKINTTLGFNSLTQIISEFCSGGDWMRCSSVWRRVEQAGGGWGRRSVLEIFYDESQTSEMVTNRVHSWHLNQRTEKGT